MTYLKKIYLGRDALFIRLMSFASKESAENFVAGNGYVEEYVLGNDDYYYFNKVERFGKISGSNPPLGPQLVEERYQDTLGNRIHKKCVEWFFNPSAELQ